MSVPVATIIKSGLCKTNVKHRPSPSLFFFPGITSSALWSQSPRDTTGHYNQNIERVGKVLKENYDVIRKEYQSLRSLKIPSDFDTSKDEHTLHDGKWEWNSYVLKGQRQPSFTAACPVTTEILESFQSPALMANTPFSFSFFSTLSGGTKIAPHYGPCNLRVRCHLPLIVPEGDCGIRIADHKLKWKQGEPIFFDDCYEHEVWNNTKDERVVLLIDLWHPELDPDEVLAVENMFDYASKQGWLK